MPATFKKRRATAGAPKAAGDEGDEKPERTEDESARATGLGRGQQRTAQ